MIVLMKKINSILALGLTLVCFSCTKTGPDTVNEITDHYAVPAGAVEMNLVKGESTWKLDRRLFDLSFSAGGSTFATTLVGYDALLTPGQYPLVPEALAARGNAIAEKTLVDGKAAADGYVTVTYREGKYTISAVLGESSVYTWTGELPFEADPDPLQLTVLQKAQSNLANNVQSVSIELATEGISQEFDWNTFQNVWKGEGKYIALDLYSEDGYLHEGTYKACAQGGVILPDEFGIGYDTEITYGDQTYPMYNWGTCLWTVSDGAATAEKITDGLVVVTRTEEGWSISWGLEYPVEVLFSGAIPTLTKPEVSDDFAFSYKEEELTDCTDRNYQVVPGVKKHPITITDAQGAVAAYLEFVLAEGNNELEGSYVSTEYASEPGQLANGYYLDYSAYGWGIIAGGSYYVDDSGEKVYIDPGVTVTVTKLAVGAYEFASDGFDISAAGPDYVPGSAGGDFVRLTQFWSITSYVGQGQMLAGVELATSDLTYSPADYSIGKWSPTYEGTGYYVKLEYYCSSESGLPAPGTYTACSEGGVVGEGEFNIGFKGQWGDYGSNWYTVTDGQPSGQYITDGTLTIEEKDGAYTLILQSSVVSFKYTGPLSH